MSEMTDDTGRQSPATGDSPSERAQQVADQARETTQRGAEQVRAKVAAIREQGPERAEHFMAKERSAAQGLADWVQQSPVGAAAFIAGTVAITVAIAWVLRRQQMKDPRNRARQAALRSHIAATREQ